MNEELKKIRGEIDLAIGTLVNAGNCLNDHLKLQEAREEHEADHKARGPHVWLEENTAKEINTLNGNIADQAKDLMGLAVGLGAMEDRVEAIDRAVFEIDEGMKVMQRQLDTMVQRAESLERRAIS